MVKKSVYAADRLRSLGINPGQVSPALIPEVIAFLNRNVTIVEADPNLDQHMNDTRYTLIVTYTSIFATDFRRCLAVTTLMGWSVKP